MVILVILNLRCSLKPCLYLAIFYHQFLPKSLLSVGKRRYIILIPCHGNYMEMIKNQLYARDLYFNIIPHQKLGFLRGGFKRLGVQKTPRRLAGLDYDAQFLWLSRWFDLYKEADYARAGTIAPQTVILEEGPQSQFSHSMEPQLRQLGLPTKLVRGVITLTREYTVCQKDDNLTPEQCRILVSTCKWNYNSMEYWYW